MLFIQASIALCVFTIIVMLFVYLIYPALRSSVKSWQESSRFREEKQQNRIAKIDQYNKSCADWQKRKWQKKKAAGNRKADLTAPDVFVSTQIVEPACPSPLKNQAATGTSHNEPDCTDAVSDWYYLCAGQVVGPLTFGEMRVQVTAGQIAPESPVRRGNEGNWIPAKKTGGLIVKHVTDQTKSGMPDAQVMPQPIRIGHPNGEQNSKNPESLTITSAILFGIGGVLLIVALIQENQLDSRDKAASRLNDSVMDLESSLGRYRDRKQDKALDRGSVYAACVLGGLFIFGGIISLSGKFGGPPTSPGKPSSRRAWWGEGDSW